jgi:hypothetical protein
MDTWGIQSASWILVGLTVVTVRLPRLTAREVVVDA